MLAIETPVPFALVLSREEEVEMGRVANYQIVLASVLP